MERQTKEETKLTFTRLGSFLMIAISAVLLLATSAIVVDFILSQIRLSNLESYRQEIVELNEQLSKENALLQDEDYFVIYSKDQQIVTPNN